MKNMFLVGILVVSFAAVAVGEWKPADGPLFTRWADKVSPRKVWQEYPRPQMVRNKWTNLNGLWDYAIVPKDSGQPQEFDGKILVPFAAESALSGVGKPVGENNQLWYQRQFRVPSLKGGKRLLLHFGAVDWHAEVWVNGNKVGSHKGGYDPFSFDITDALNKRGEQELTVSVWDPTDTWTQPRGKQVREPQGIWYTAVTGIWQTVWLEPVPEASITELNAVPDIDSGVLSLKVYGTSNFKGVIKAVAKFDGKTVGQAEGESFGDEIVLKIPNARLWSPYSPNLYDLEVSLSKDGKEIDKVEGYFGMRKISLEKAEDGFNRLFLNNKPLFQLGPLDQGWWPDGLYTAPTDDALKYDIEITKELGFNMLRKHVKVEPARFYYHCDKLGMMVWQDMPSGCLQKGAKGDTLRVGAGDAEDAIRPADSARQFEYELKGVIDAMRCFPSIVMWVPFNEGWGQYDTARIAAWVKEYDPSRLVNAVSGWTDRRVSDVLDIHSYPGPAIKVDDTNRAAVLGEFGGLGWPVEGHLWWNKRNWGYRTYQTRKELNDKYDEVVGNVYGLLGQGLAAAVYTQTTDVEGEVNGLMTYDREVVKYDPARLRAIHSRLYRSSPKVSYLIPASQDEVQKWSYTFSNPGQNWQTATSTGGNWKEGDAPFQSESAPFIPQGTPWKGKQIMLRRTFDVKKVPTGLWMKTYLNVKDFSVYINGQLVAELKEPRATRRHYRHFDLSEHVGVLKPGSNIIAVHATKETGIRVVDLGLYAVDARD